MSTEIVYQSATGLVDLFRRKAISPVEVTEAALRQIDKYDRYLNAFSLVDAEGALESARRSEQRWMKGAPAGLVDGVPTSVKDVMLTRGWPSLKGSRTVSRDQAWDEDSPAVARLREHGAVLLGKTTMAEFGWKATGDSPLTGITRNPWNLQHTPGGSSSGAAASIAAGMGALAVGTDGGGSIRIPCSFTGLAGIKATFGRVPSYPSNPMGMLVNVGPMTRTVADTALLLTVLEGTDDRDPYCLPAADETLLDGLADGVRDLRIGYVPSFGGIPVDPEVARAVAAAAAEFTELHANVETVESVDDLPREAFITLWSAGLAYAARGMSAEQRAQLDPGLERMMREGEKLSAADFVAADFARNEFSRRMARMYRKFDLLLTPTVAVAALRTGCDLNDPQREKHFIDWAPFSYPFNLTRQPAATVRCGMNGSGLPIGLQIVGRRYEDARVLRAARAYEARHPFVAPDLSKTCTTAANLSD